MFISMVKINLIKLVVYSYLLTDKSKYCSLENDKRI